MGKNEIITLFSTIFTAAFYQEIKPHLFPDLPAFIDLGIIATFACALHIILLYLKMIKVEHFYIVAYSIAPASLMLMFFGQGKIETIDTLFEGFKNVFIITASVGSYTWLAYTISEGLIRSFSKIKPLGFSFSALVILLFIVTTISYLSAFYFKGSYFMGFHINEIGVALIGYVLFVIFSFVIGIPLLMILQSESKKHLNTDSSD